jgi:hypothetical protein
MTQLSAYRVPPLHEWKAARELRDHGIKAYVPRDPGSDRKAPLARGYVFSTHNPAFSKHVRQHVGRVTSAELARLYVKRQRRRAQEVCPYSVGQIVYKGEIQAKVIEIRGRTCIVETILLGKAHSQAIPYAQLRPG